jgi:hypothetical protein
LKALLSFGYKTFVADRLKAFTLDELHAFVSRLNVAATVEPLDEVASALREELIDELKEGDAH